jgi:hypothetical protein
VLRVVNPWVSKLAKVVGGDPRKLPKREAMAYKGPKGLPKREQLVTYS